MKKATRPKRQATPAKLPIRGDKYDRAVRLLQDACDDRVVLMQNDELELYLIPSVLPEETEAGGKPGTIEYQVSDGQPGERSHSEDGFDLREAVRLFKEVEDAGGWQAFYRGRPAKKKAEAATKTAVPAPASARFAVLGGAGGPQHMAEAWDVAQRIESRLRGMTAECKADAADKVHAWCRDSAPGDVLFFTEDGEETLVVIRRSDNGKQTMLTTVVSVRVEVEHREDDR